MTSIRKLYADAPRVGNWQLMRLSTHVGVCAGWYIAQRVGDYDISIMHAHDEDAGGSPFVVSIVGVSNWPSEERPESIVSSNYADADVVKELITSRESQLAAYCDHVRGEEAKYA